MSFDYAYLSLMSLVSVVCNVNKEGKNQRSNLKEQNNKI